MGTIMKPSTSWSKKRGQNDGVELENGQDESDRSQSLVDVDDFHASESSFSPDEAETTQSDTLEKIDRKEAKAVLLLRLLVLFVLLVVAAVASVGIYFYSQTNETSQFEVDFAGVGEKVIGAIQEGSYRKMQAMDSLSSALTSHALEHNLTWPFVTFANSANLFEPHLSLADAASIVLQPIVSAEMRDKWEAYALEHQGWISKDIEAREDLFKSGWNTSEHETNTKSEAKDYAQASVTPKERKVEAISPYIKNYVGIDTTPGPYVTWWQYAPVIENSWFVNFNRLA